MTLGLVEMAKISRSCFDIILLGSLILLIAQDCSGDEIACNNETFIGKEAKMLGSKDILPCDDSENVCFVIPSKLNTLCNISSGKYSFNFSSSWKRCTKFARKTLYPCKLLPHGVTCRDDQLSQCHSESLLNCLFSIDVYVIVGNFSFKQFIVKMYQVPKYVPYSFLRVNKLYLEVLSSTEIKIVWSRPDCELLTYSYYWTIKVTGTNEIRPTDASTVPDRKEDVIHKRMIRHLKPFTNYTICLKSSADLFYKWISGACETNQTLPAAPSKAPEIYSDKPSRVASGKWQCLIEWKNVDKEYWNGIIDKIKINLFDKALPKSKRSIFVPVDKSSHLISPLDVQKEYLVQLEFCNSAGCTHSNKRFISFSRKAIQGTSDINWLLVLLIVGGAVLIFVFILATVLICRKRRPRTVRLRQSLGPRGEVPDPGSINPVHDDDSHIYEEINNGGYDEIDNLSSSSTSNIPVNIVVEEHAVLQMLQNGNEENLAGEMPGTCAGASRFIDNVTWDLNKDQGFERVSPYRSLAECRRHVGECSCHMGGASGSTRTQGTWNKSLTSDHEPLLNHTDQLESSEDDRSRAESYELDSNRSFRSSSVENEPLI